MATPVKKLSGMQRQVLALYRGFLRAAGKRSPEDRERIRTVVTKKFRNNGDKRNLVYMEYLVRRGKEQLDQLNDPGKFQLKWVIKSYQSNGEVLMQKVLHFLIPK